MPKSLIDNVGWIAAVVSILGAAGAFISHAQQEAVERDRDRQHIRVLERIVVSEHPDYSPMIEWDDK